MNPTVIAVVRTLTAYVVGAILAGLTLARIVVPEEGAAALTGVLVIVLANAYYLLVTLLARVWPWIGYLLIIPSSPTYGAGSDLLWAFLRTLIPSIVGYLLGLIPASVIVLDAATQTSILLAVTTTVQAGYYSLFKWAETRVPWLSILLGGRPNREPVYVARHAS